MQKNMKKKERLIYLLESKGPIVFALGGAIVILFVANKYGLGDCFNKILDSTIVFSSIIVGFMGALLGILYSIRSTKLLKKLFNYRENRDILKNYFRQCILSGIFLVAVTISLYIRKYLRLTFLVADVFAWGFLLIYMFCCTYRIVNIMMKIIFEDNFEEEQNGSGSRKIHVMPDEKRKHELEEKYSR